MLLEEIEYKSDLMKMAMDQQVKTVEEFEIWLMGYTTGYKISKNENIKSIKDTFRELLNER